MHIALRTHYMIQYNNRDISLLSGVYTFAFLGVMTIFSVGCMLLKFKRPSLPREVSVGYGTIMIGIVCVFTAFMGNMVSSTTTSSTNNSSIKSSRSGDIDANSSSIVVVEVSAVQYHALLSAVLLELITMLCSALAV
jgi:hypothetical protein